MGLLSYGWCPWGLTAVLRGVPKPRCKAPCPAWKVEKEGKEVFDSPSGGRKKHGDHVPVASPLGHMTAYPSQTRLSAEPCYAVPTV